MDNIRNYLPPTFGAIMKCRRYRSLNCIDAYNKLKLLLTDWLKKLPMVYKRWPIVFSS